MRRVSYLCSGSGRPEQAQKYDFESPRFPLFGIKECAVVYQKLGDGLGQVLTFVFPHADAASEDLQKQVAAIVLPYMVPWRVTSSTGCRRMQMARSTGWPLIEWRII